MVVLQMVRRHTQTAENWNKFCREKKTQEEYKWIERTVTDFSSVKNTSLLVTLHWCTNHSPQFILCHRVIVVKHTDLTLDCTACQSPTWRVLSMNCGKTSQRTELLFLKNRLRESTMLSASKHKKYENHFQKGMLGGNNKHWHCDTSSKDKNSWNFNNRDSYNKNFQPNRNIFTYL